MPELPEVEATRIRVDRAARGKRIVKVHARPDARLFDEISALRFTKMVTGAKVTGSDRRGKYFWLKLDQKPWPIFHLGMTGYFEILKAKKGEILPKAGKSLRMEMELDNGTRVRFYDPRRFGRVRVSDDPLHTGAISKLGYDPLFDFPTPSALHALISKRRAPIKAILLDQSLFAGVGNWIADEALFQAKLSPHRLGTTLSAADTTTLRKAILKVVKKAVEVSAEKDRFPKNWLFAHRWGKSKDAQISSGEKIIHETIGGRTSAWVPTLQK